MVPDIHQRDVYVCGPYALASGVLKNLRELKVPSRQVHAEVVALGKLTSLFVRTRAVERLTVLPADTGQALAAFAIASAFTTAPGLSFAAHLGVVSLHVAPLWSEGHAGRGRARRAPHRVDPAAEVVQQGLPGPLVVPARRDRAVL